MPSPRLTNPAARPFDGYVPQSQRPTVHRSGKTRCTEPGCITLLCSYNEGPLCYAHAGSHAQEVEAADQRRWMRTLIRTANRGSKAIA